MSEKRGGAAGSFHGQLRRRSRRWWRIGFSRWLPGLAFSHQFIELFPLFRGELGANLLPHLAKHLLNIWLKDDEIICDLLAAAADNLRNAPSLVRIQVELLGRPADRINSSEEGDAARGSSWRGFVDEESAGDHAGAKDDHGCERDEDGSRRVHQPSSRSASKSGSLTEARIVCSSWVEKL